MMRSQTDLMAGMLAPYFRDVAASLPEPDRGLVEVLAQVATTPQSRSRWPFGRRSVAPSSPSQGRPQAMFSAAKLVVASVIVALVGSALFAAFLAAPDEESPPIVGATASPSVRPEPTAAPEPTPTPEPSDASTPEPTELAVAVEPFVDRSLIEGERLTVLPIESDVVRIEHDGVHKRLVTGTPTPWGPGNGRIVAGLDGSVWIFGPDRFFRVGDKERHRYWSSRGSRVDPSDVDFAVAPDGTVWASGAYPGGDTVGPVDGSRVHSFDGKRWRVRRRAPALRSVPGDAPSAQTFSSIHATPDGTIWAVATNPDEPRTTLHRLDEDGWKAFRVPRREGSSFDAVVSVEGAPVTIEDRDQNHRFLARTAAPDGKGGFWLGGAWDYPGVSKLAEGIGTDGEFLTDGLVHFDGQDWRMWDLGLLDTDSYVPPVFQDILDGQPFFEGKRFVDGRWERAPAGGETWPEQLDGALEARLTADGQAWWPGDDKEDAERILAEAPVNELFESQDEWEAFMRVHGSCGGIVASDAVSETRYLEDLCVTSHDVAPDGSVWVLASERPEYLRPKGDQRRGRSIGKRTDVYVIRPGSGA